jgi:SAM-dependent methyltransferase
MHGIPGYGAKRSLLLDAARNRRVLHLGVTGDVSRPVDDLVAQARTGLHLALTQAAAQCVGVEINAAAVAAIADAGIFSNCLVVDVRKLERAAIPLATIDLIIAGDIIEHLDDPGALLDTAARVADPQTRLLITTPNAISATAVLRYACGRPLEGGEAQHVVSFNRYSLGNLLRLHGWQVEAWATCYQEHSVGMHAGLAFRMGTMFFRAAPHWGGTLLVIARK